MDWLQEFKELHYKELELKKELDSRITAGITLLTILGSAQILLWTKLKDFNNTPCTLIYVILCAITTILFMICIFTFYRVHAGYLILRFPIKKMNHYYTDIWLNVGADYCDDAISEIKENIIKCYTKSTLHNREQNNKRIKRQGYFIHAVLITLIITFITFGYSTGLYIYKTQNEEVQVMSEDNKLNASNHKEILDKNGRPMNISTMEPEPSVEIFTLGGFGALRSDDKKTE